MLSINDIRMFDLILLGPLLSVSLKMFSMTEISVEVVSKPQKQVQSFTTKPEPINSEPRLTVPAINGICSREESSSCTSTLMRGCTRPPTKNTN